MTWGQLRLTLKKEFAAIADTELLASYLQETYEEILGEREWEALETIVTLQTKAPFSDGTVTVTNGSDTVTGTETAWDVTMVGSKVRFGIDSGFYQIAAVNSSTELVLSVPYSGEDDTDAAHEIFQDVVTLPIGVRKILDVECPALGKPMLVGTSDDYGTTDPSRLYGGIPRKWWPGIEATEPGGQQVRTLRVFPSPDDVYELIVTFTQAVPGFDGTNTSDSPIAFVPSSVLLAGARSRCCANRLVNDLNGANHWRNIYEIAMKPMRDSDTVRRTPTRLRPPWRQMEAERDEW